MIPNGKKLKRSKNSARPAKSKGREAKSKWGWWHYLSVKRLSALLREMKPKCYVDFHCLNFLHSFKKKLKLYKKVSEKREDFCNVIMPFKDTKIFEFSQY